uniref:Uncharacterized protein n=1 Tax=Anguilla anguilla TaxID=7936 RepID=A0A0E9W7S0_ANGAN
MQKNVSWKLLTVICSISFTTCMPANHDLFFRASVHSSTDSITAISSVRQNSKRIKSASEPGTGWRKGFF